ncbi:carbohydrate sulfotransferase 1-like [Saccoglossus kowalevskii]|uniref:Carbohydrate sulfotransferase 1-like n=1 Tax=Saccoglossus kowalevskii TaxID=10224 RepID=A0ABM0GPZ4_SACKO|nr:PREDICTED: carbohydrate sulfotransferase 1-like [Saccoglossus kowalevskii]
MFNVPPTRPSPAVMLIANYKGGSIFCGELFNQNPDMCYFFEPLFDTQDKPTWNSSIKATSTLKELYNCRFPDYYLDMINNFSLTKSKSNCFKKVCHSGFSCQRTVLSEFVQGCGNYKYIAMKVLRLQSLKVLKPLVLEEKIDLKIIHLIRDPSGIACSRTCKGFWDVRRRKIIEKQSDLLKSVVHDCKQVFGMVLYAKNMPTWLQDRYKIVRYEDLASDPITIAKDIYKFLHMDIPYEVTSWIEENTKNEEQNEGRLKRSRNSSATAESWNVLSYQEAKCIQSVCTDIIEVMDYKMLTSETELQNLSYRLL